MDGYTQQCWMDSMKTHSSELGEATQIRERAPKISGLSATAGDWTQGGWLLTLLDSKADFALTDTSRLMVQRQPCKGWAGHHNSNDSLICLTGELTTGRGRPRVSPATMTGVE